MYNSTKYIICLAILYLFYTLHPQAYHIPICTHPSDRVDLTLPVRVTLGPWWLRGRSIDSELVCRLVMLWQLSVSLLPAEELQAGQGLALEGRERPEAGLEAGESVHRSGVLLYRGLLPPL